MPPNIPIEADTEQTSGLKIRRRRVLVLSKAKTCEGVNAVVSAGISFSMNSTVDLEIRSIEDYVEVNKNGISFR